MHICARSEGQSEEGQTELLFWPQAHFFYCGERGAEPNTYCHLSHGGSVSMFTGLFLLLRAFNPKTLRFNTLLRRIQHDNRLLVRQRSEIIHSDRQEW